MESITELSGKTAFLNGQKGLHDMEARFSRSLIEHKKKVVVIDDLFENPKKLLKVVKCNNIVLFTTGQNHEEINSLVGAFEKLQYVPKVVIFVTENTALIFCGIARELKKKGTQFYFFDCMDNKTLYDIGWL